MSKRILIFTTAEGHYSLAEASRDYLEKNFHVRIIKYDFDRVLGVYRQFYLFFPSLNKIPYEIGKKGKIINMALKLYEKTYSKKVYSDILHFKPDLIISTYTAFNNVISDFISKQLRQIPFINIIANPQILPIEFEQNADSNLVYDSSGVRSGIKYKIPKNKIEKIGWLVRKAYYQKYDKKKLLKRFDFSDAVFTCLICGGSEGTNAIVKILPALLISKNALQVIVVCGNNKSLYQRLKKLQFYYQKLQNSDKSIAKKLKINKNVKLKILGFEKNMASLIQISDLVVGKAGPNLLFETAACGKPFMAITHISGQEDKNLNLIKEKQLGLVEENPLKAIKLLKKIMGKPELLNMTINIKKEAKINNKAGEKLEKLVSKLLKTQ